MQFYMVWDSIYAWNGKNAKFLGTVRSIKLLYIDVLNDIISNRFSENITTRGILQVYLDGP